MIIKYYIVIFFSLIWMSDSHGQDCNEFLKHLKSIDDTYQPGHILDRMDTVFNANRAFVDYTMDYLLDQPSDSCFIANRNLLRKLNDVHCDSSTVIIEDTLKKGENCIITFTTKKFESKSHEIIINKDSSIVKKIDGEYPFGGEYGNPEMEIGIIQIQVNGVNLDIPHESYGNLYEPNVCENHGFERQIEAYESLSGDYIYLYIYGGEAAGTYFAKLIFDKTNYITKIVSDYYSLSVHSSFRENFIGY